MSFRQHQFVFLLLCSSIQVCLGLTGEELKANFLIDVLKSYYKPSIVFAFDCWASSFKSNLTKSLGNLDKPILIKFYDEQTHFTRLSPEHHVVFLVDASCNSTKYILEKANNNTNFRRPFHWFILNKDGGDTIPIEIQNVDMLPDSEVAVVNRIRNDSYVLYLVYKITTNSVWRTEYYGEWNIYAGFHKATTLGTSTAMRRRDLEQYLMPIAYVIINPDSINHFVDRGNGEIDTLSKVNYHTTNNVLYFMNAGKRFFLTNTWGYEVNGTWTGLTGFMVRKEIEFGDYNKRIYSEKFAKWTQPLTTTSALTLYICGPPTYDAWKIKIFKLK